MGIGRKSATDRRQAKNPLAFGYAQSKGRVLDRIEIEGSTFAHHAAPKVPNIGDKLCAPYLYFRFSLMPRSRLPGRCLVVGGGAIAGARDLYRDAGYRARIVWAAGTSRGFGPRPSRPSPSLLRRVRAKLGLVKRSVIRGITRLREGREVVIVSTRDPEPTTPDMFVPCVSCFHDVCERPRGTGVAVILNENPDVSGEAGALLEALRARCPEIICATNAMTEAELMEVFANTDRIITNSYHMTYWGLLSGGKVRAIGYSSKLVSLLGIFGFAPDHLLRYSRGDQAGLETALHTALDTDDWLSLPDPDAVRARFRRLNLDFATHVMQAIPDLTITPAPHAIETGAGPTSLEFPAETSVAASHRKISRRGRVSAA